MATFTIQDRELRLVIEHAGHSHLRYRKSVNSEAVVALATHPLLLATAQHIPPLLACRPTAFPRWKIRQVHSRQDLHQLLVRPARRNEVWIRVRVNDSVNASRVSAAPHST